MTYATQADLETAIGAEELIRLTDRVNIPPTTINTATVAEKLAAANGLADSYLGERYPLPIPVTADTAASLALLRGLVCDIARYMLLTVAPDSDVQLKYDAAIRTLRDIQRGAAGLPGVPTGVTASAGMVEVVTSPGVFGRGVRG